jgi:Flp pilus assembly protein TadG
MPARFRTRFSVAAACREFRRDRKGSAAIQFAVLGIPFLMMIFAILEVALSFFAGQALETATQDASRMIMTLQANDAAAFKTNLCSRTTMFPNCNGSMYVDVQSYSSFASIPQNSLVDGSGNFAGQTRYSPGNQGDIVVVQATYPWPVFVTGLGFNWGTNGGSYRYLTATAAFRNEPR